MRRGVVVLDDSADGMTPEHILENHLYGSYPSLLGMISELREPHRIVLVATFESFNLTARREFIARCAVVGHKIVTVPAREMTRWRFRTGSGPKPSNQGLLTDIEDAVAIRAQAKYGGHLKVPGEGDPWLMTARRDANHKLMLLRSTGAMAKRPRSPGYKLIPHKDAYAQDVIDMLPPFSEQPDVRQTALGKDGQYHPVIAAAVGVAAEFAATRDQFDRLAGLHVHAPGSQIRSDLMFWVWAGGNKRQHLNPETRKRDDMTLSEYRRELRWLFRQIRTARGQLTLRPPAGGHSSTSREALPSPLTGYRRPELSP